LPEEECGAVSDFVVVAHVVVNADSEPSEEELAVLADSFVRSYNQANTLNGGLCDFFWPLEPS
jgi:hypothetical protein